MTDCILKLNNTNVEKLNIKSTNGYKLLSSDNSRINKSSFSMAFNHDGIGDDNISDRLINTNYSSLNIDVLDVRNITITDYIVYSANHSNVFVERIRGIGNASPNWTGKLFNQPIYGNGMSYNVFSGEWIDDTITFNDSAMCNVKYNSTSHSNMLITDISYYAPISYSNVMFSDNSVCNIV